ncbi:MAG: B12-binding domain-containing radical SAM protein [Melioribacteraceae bacterium]|nr:B12-binding domain-containing radical SAM protein [Melioribacteraceae bacterium]
MDSEFKRRLSPSLSLVTIATLTPEPHEVYIEDENIKPINFSDSPDLVGITVNVDTTYRAIEISNQYRNKGSKVIFGGIHASANYESLQNYCDSICVGEAENLWPEIINDFISGNLKKNYSNSSPPDLSLVPIPNWNYISKKDYLYNNIIVTSRGCPYKCEFCYNSCEYVFNKFRTKPINNILVEINRLNTKQVMFIDDNLLGNIKWYNEFLDSLLPLNLIWHGAVSANIVEYPELIYKTAKSGCKSLFIGFESINEDSIKSASKEQNKIDKYELLINLLHENNIMVNASLVFGFDFDTKDIFSKTLDWLIRNKIETMTSHILTPYPGTKLYKKLLNENRIIDFDLRKYNTSNVVFNPKNMTADELKEGYLDMYKEFYSIKNIIKRLPQNKNLILPYLTFNLCYRKYGKITSLIGKFGLMNFIGTLGRKISYGID